MHRMNTLTAAVIQLTCTEDVERNLGRAIALCEAARRRGAELALLPENFALMGADETKKFAIAEALPALGAAAGEGAGPVLARMQEAARRLSLRLVLGGFPERSEAPDRVYNSCLYLDEEGRLRAAYRKIHLFDAAPAGDAKPYRESATVAAGAVDQAVVVDTGLSAGAEPARVGLSVCYDLRFPGLYRRLARGGARILVVPAAFTLQTGKDHWHVLLRARAIENQCFVLAAAQQGTHPGNRQTYGHSLIVNPWGTVLAECADGEGVALTELHFADQDRVRREVPCLQNRRLPEELG